MNAYAWMLVGSFIFAVMGTIAHLLRETCDWQVIALARAALALVFAAMLARAAKAQLVFWKPPVLWMRSVAGSFSMICTFFAFTRLPVSDVLTITNMFPIWVALLSGPLLGEPPAADVWLSIASGVTGMVLIQQPHIAAGNFAVLIALASSVSTAIAMMGLHKLQDIDARAIVVHFSCVSTLFCFLAFALFEHSAFPPALNGTALLMLLGIGASATLGQICLTKAFAAGPPAKVSVVGLTQIVFGMALDAYLFEHRFGPMKVLGTALVVAPTAWLLMRR